MILLIVLIAVAGFLGGYVIGFDQAHNRKGTACSHANVSMGTDGNFYCARCSEWVY